MTDLDTTTANTAGSSTFVADDPAVTTVAGVLELTHRFADELPELSLPWRAATVPRPGLVAINMDLAAELGLDPDRLADPDGVAVLAGNLVPSGAHPVALAYAGHQFGAYSPRLGDGRALLLGELYLADGGLLDVHLKGSGRTPFARGGDGKATLGPMLREFIVSEAMHRLGVATTRSLAVVTTGEGVYRDGMEPGAVLTRVAASHIRVGTFEFALRLGGTDLVRRLADHSIARHHPSAAEADNRYLALLEAVVDAQALLVAKWMTLGFIHGVMNTDNMTISGEGIDYGPCAFMDTYDPASVFSSIDHGGRYAYGNQVRVAAWNLARLAETMLELFAEESERAVALATDVVNGFVERFGFHWRGEMAAKLGFDDVGQVSEGLFDDLLTVMQSDELDWTSTYRSLAAALRAGAAGAGSVGEGDNAMSPAYRSWFTRWREQLLGAGLDPLTAAARMDAHNPVYIPRNHILQETLDAATRGDLGAFGELRAVLADPFTEQPGKERFAQPATAAFTSSFRTFCGT